MADDAATPNAAASAAAAAAMAAAGVAAKSALKVREKPVIRHDDPLGTYELPECPYSLFQPDLHLLPPSPSLLTFVGSANGVVIGLYTQRLATAVLRFVAANRTKVRLEVRGTNQTVKKAAALFTKECAAAVKKETKRLQRLARQTRREAAEKAKEEQRVARAAARAQARANAAADSEDDEQQEEEEAYEQEEEEEEEEGEEEEETEGEDGQDTEDNNADTGALRYLSDEQRAELKTFVEAREKERDDKIAALTSAATAHLAKVEPLALTPYIRTGEQLLQQKSVTFGRAGKETVLGVVAAVGGRVYAAQSDHVVPVDVALGMLKLA